MRPEYANAFGLRKVSDKEGQLLEVTLDISYKYMENAITVNAQGGIENVGQALVLGYTRSNDRV